MSDFRMIREDQIVAMTSNVPITEIEWTPGTYPYGTQRYVGTDLYEAVIETDDDPVTGSQAGAQTWVRIGKINRWKMFSEFIAEKTTAPSPITFVVDVPPGANAIAFFGVSGAVQATVTTYEDGVETGQYDLQFSNNASISNWFEWFFDPVVVTGDAASFDLPGYGTTQIAVQIEGEGDVNVGRVVVGRQFTIGRTGLYYRAGIWDFSRKERDEFGGYSITPRRYAKTMEATVYVPQSRIDAVLRALAEVRAVPTVYVGGDDTPETIVFGFYTDAQVARITPGHGELHLEIEGLT